MTWQPKNKNFVNKRIEVDGEKFDSIAEARCWRDLKLMQASGVISDLKRQVRFDLIVNSKKLGFMRLDFTYLEKGQQTAFDWKGYKNQDALWNWKRKHFEAQYKDWILRTNLDDHI